MSQRTRSRIGYRWEWPVWDKTAGLRRVVTNPANAGWCFLVCVTFGLLGFMGAGLVTAIAGNWSAQQPTVYRHGMTMFGWGCAVACAPMLLNLLWLSALGLWGLPRGLCFGFRFFRLVLLALIPRRRLHLLSDDEVREIEKDLRL